MKRIVLSCLFVLLLLFDLTAQEISLSEMFEQNRESIVFIQVYWKNSKGKWMQSSGSGVVATADGKIFTNYHVIDKFDKIEIRTYNKNKFSNVKVLKTDMNRDIAVLQIVSNSHFIPAIVDILGELTVGEDVVAIGNPKGLTWSPSKGNVSGLPQDREGMIHHNAPTSPGSSGGGLFNAKGELIGITSSHVDGGQNLNYAIPIKEFIKFIDNTELITKRTSNIDKVDAAIDEGNPRIDTLTTDPQQKSSESSSPEICINLIIDHSLSMKGDRIKYAHNSIVTFFELIDSWKKNFPKELANLNVQLIKFGGYGESEIIYPLQKVDDIDYVISKIKSSKVQYMQTIYDEGFGKAIHQLNNKAYSITKTILLTDGLDEAPQPMLGDYTSLGEVQFLIFNDKVTSLPLWEHKIPNSSVYQLSNEFEVTSILLQTLFSLIDNNNEYLIRQGNIDSDGFDFFKHNNDNLSLIVIPLSKKNLRIESIKSKDNEVIEKDKYQIEQKDTFIQIKLTSNLSSGNYQIQFNNIASENTLKWISFEKANIVLMPFTIDGKQLSKEYVAGSSQNFQLNFWDILTKTMVTYPEFLNHVSFSYLLTPNQIYKKSNSIYDLRFSYSLSPKVGEEHTIHTNWGYNYSKLKQPNPKNKPIAKFTTVKKGNLVEVRYDTTYTWEGRSLNIEAEIVDGVNSSVNALFLLVNGEKLKLEKSGNVFTGVIEDLKTGNYSLSFSNDDVNTYEVSAKSISTFFVKERIINIYVESPDYAEVDEKLSFGKKFSIAWSKIFGTNKDYEVNKENRSITQNFVDFSLPYKSELKGEYKLSIEPNKLFPDEKLIGKMTHIGEASFIAKNETEPSLFFTFPSEKEFTITSQDKSFLTTFKVEKNKGKHYFPEIVEPKPIIKIPCTIISQAETSVEKEYSLVFNFKTSYSDWWINNIVDVTIYIIVIIVSIILLFIILLLLLFIRRRKVRKMEVWQEIKDKSPEDFLIKFPKTFRDNVRELYAKSKEISQDDNISEIRKFKTVLEKLPKKMEKIALKNCDLFELKQLKKLVTTPYQEKSFSFILETGNRLDIVAFEKDSIYNETKIRTRNTILANYGEIRSEANKTVLIKESIPTYKNNNLIIDNQTELKTGDIINFDNHVVLTISILNENNLQLIIKNNQ
ncbi:trypsin-like peptidase domain-containing protein [bacterium]|nr:trypsin-like peptidase domain-containing protein [bacterium]